MRSLKMLFHQWSYYLAMFFEKLFYSSLCWLAEHKIIHRIKYNSTIPIGNKFLSPFPDLKGPRYRFKITGVQQSFKTVLKDWFETKSGKRIYTIQDSVNITEEVKLKAELQSFVAHFSFNEDRVVERRSDSPVTCVYFFSPEEVLRDSEEDQPIPLKATTKYVDFSKCSYMFTYQFNKVEFESHSDPVQIVYNRLKDELNNKIVEINETLTGVPYDASPTTATGFPLADYIVCCRCGTPVFSTKIPYIYTCPLCGRVEAHQIQVLPSEEYNSRLSIRQNEILAFCKMDRETRDRMNHRQGDNNL